MYPFLKQALASTFVLAMIQPAFAQQVPPRPTQPPQKETGQQTPGRAAETAPRQAPMNPFPQPLFRMDGVAQHLNLTPDQLSQMNSATQNLQKRFQPELEKLNGLDEKTRSSRLQGLLGTFNTDMTKSMGGLLNDGQMNRMRQLELQQRGFDAFSSPDLQKQLGLSGDQLTKLSDAGKQSQQQLRDIAGRLQSDPQAGQGLLKDFQKQSNDLLKRILTPQQQSNWSDLAGQPFNFPPSAQLPFGQGGYPGYGSTPSGGGSAGGGGGKEQGGGRPPMDKEQPTTGGVKPMPPVVGGKTATGFEKRSTQASPFPEPLFRMDHVVRKLDIKPEQFDRLTTATVQLQRRFQPDIERLNRLEGKVREARYSEMMTTYTAEWMKAAESILNDRQVASYRNLADAGRQTELSTDPDRQRAVKPGQ